MNAMVAWRRWIEYTGRANSGWIFASNATRNEKRRRDALLATINKAVKRKAGTLELITNKPNSTSRRFFISGVIWAVVGALYGLVAALELIAPDLYAGIEWLT